MILSGPGIDTRARDRMVGRAVCLIELEDGADEATADRRTCSPADDQYTVIYMPTE